MYCISVCVRSCNPNMNRRHRFCTVFPSRPKNAVNAVRYSLDDAASSSDGVLGYNAEEDDGWESCSLESDQSLGDAATTGTETHKYVLRAPNRERNLSAVVAGQSLELPHSISPLEPRAPDLTPLPFQYLHLGENEIRLLEVLPGKEHEIMSCTLHHVPVDSDRAYEAVSYAWDTGPMDHLIMVNGCALQVSQTLEAALVQFRREITEPVPAREKALSKLESNIRNSYDQVDHWPMQCPERPSGLPYLIWIDFVCIDQTNVQERSEQILLMRQIYSRARRLKIWLGEERNRSSTAIRFFQMYAKAFFEGPRALQRLFERLASKNIMITIYAIAMLLDRQWFHRAWVLQEYALCSKVVPMTYCGREKLPWFTLRIFRNDSDNHEQVSRFITYDSETTWYESGMRFEVMYRDPALYTPYALLSLVKSGTARWTWLEVARHTHRDGPPHLLKWLEIGQYLKASNPRDKVYALLGLVQDGNEEEGDAEFILDDLIIDYTASVEQVMASIVRSIVKATSSLEALRFAPTKQIFAYPTWATDWAVDNSANTTRGELDTEDRHFKPARDTTARYAFADDLSTFTVQGIKWDRAVQTYIMPGHLSDTTALFEFQSIAAYARDHLDVESLPEFKHRFVCSLNIFTDSDEDVWTPILDEYMLEFDNGQLSPQARRVIRLQCSEYSLSEDDRFMITEKGYIGRSAEKVEVGDFVCVLLGCDAPMVLRPADEYYQLIGEVYCHGIMDGEVMDALDRGDCQLQDFVLC